MRDVQLNDATIPLTMMIRFLSHDLTETTREMVKRGTDDLKRLVTLGNTLVCAYDEIIVEPRF